MTDQSTDPPIPVDPPALPAPADAAGDWFWTGVPAGFVVSVVGAFVWLLTSLWLALIVVIALAVGLGFMARRDGRASLMAYLRGGAITFVPSFVLFGIVIHTFLSSLTN